jgi:hypothetical protein
MSDVKVERWIEVKFTKEGIHKYPEASTDPALATNDEYDVSFLGVPHRHIFHFYVSLKVEHDNREVEFIQFKRWLENLFKEQTLNINFKSCEMLANDLFNMIQTHEKYSNRETIIKVYEDDENGAILKFTSENDC